MSCRKSKTVIPLGSGSLLSLRVDVWGSVTVFFLIMGFIGLSARDVRKSCYTGKFTGNHPIKSHYFTHLSLVSFQFFNILVRSTGRNVGSKTLFSPLISSYLMTNRHKVIMLIRVSVPTLPHRESPITVTNFCKTQ